MRYLAITGICAGSLCLAGCQPGNVLSASGARAPSLTPVSSIVNAIKCELADTFSERTLPNGTKGNLATLIAPDAKGADVSATLSLANVVVNAKGGEGGLELPVGGVTVGPSVSGSRAHQTEQSYELKFSYDLEPNQGVPDFCANSKVKVEGDPFVDMLEGIAAQYELLGKGEPKVKLASIAYASKFEIKEEISAGVKVKFLVFSVGSKATHTNVEKQALTLAFGLNFAAVILNQ